jgi:hypothetical protein
MTIRFGQALLVLIFSGCDAGTVLQAAGETGVTFQKSAVMNSRALNEVSGIQAGEGDVFFVHNDDRGPVIHIIDLEGRQKAQISIRDGKNRDWEDITIVPREAGRLLVLGDIGDNNANNKTIRLYFVEEPVPDQDGHYPPVLDLLHKLKAKYPDGPRDCEAMAYDPGSDMILFLTKRDKPPRLYGLPLEKALSFDKFELELLGEVPTFRPPTTMDLLNHKKRGQWMSQPTGMDISADGKRAAVITYRSLYLYSREDGESWADAFQRTPLEFLGPKGLHDEAVTFGHDPLDVYVSSEGVPAPLYKLTLP